MKTRNKTGIVSRKSIKKFRHVIHDLFSLLFLKSSNLGKWEQKNVIMLSWMKGLEDMIMTWMNIFQWL